MKRCFAAFIILSGCLYPNGASAIEKANSSYLYFAVGTAIFRVDESLNLDEVRQVTADQPMYLRTFSIGRSGGARPLSAIVGERSLVSFVGNQIEPMGTVQGTSPEVVHSISIDSKNRVWMSGNSGVYIHDGQIKKVSGGFAANWIAVVRNYLLGSAATEVHAYEIVEEFEKPTIEFRASVTSERFADTAEAHLPSGLTAMAMFVNDENNVTIAWTDFQAIQGKYRAYVTECAFNDILMKNYPITCTFFRRLDDRQLWGITRLKSNNDIIVSWKGHPFLTNVMTNKSLDIPNAIGEYAKWVQSVK
jgi:hypothetical protein